MTLPNPPSEGVHRAMGFQPIGTCRRIGFEHGRWRGRAAGAACTRSYDGEPGTPS